MSSNSDAISAWVKGTSLAVYLDIPFKNTEMKGDIFCTTTATCIHVPLWIETFIDVQFLEKEKKMFSSVCLIKSVCIWTFYIVLNSKCINYLTPAFSMKMSFWILTLRPLEWKRVTSAETSESPNQVVKAKFESAFCSDDLLR